MQYQNLKSHIKAHIGPNKKYDAIPLEKLPQKIHTFSTSAGLLSSIRKGSSKYRRIIERNATTTFIHNHIRWKKKLGDETITYEQVKKAMIHLHSPYLDSTSADLLFRLKLGKTMFNNQLHTIELLDDNTCNTCIREYNQNIIEDYKHALFQCPAVQTVIHTITDTFFPRQASPFTISDILLSTNTNIHFLYKGLIGQEVSSLIWNFFQVYILQCRTGQKTPICTSAIFEIKSQLQRILNLLPKSKLATFIKTSPELHNIISENHSL